VISCPLDAHELILKSSCLTSSPRTAAEGEACLHTELVGRFKELLRAMLQYVKTRHPQGVSWNPNGKTLSAPKPV